eukprot:CAMPEP_0183401832 /NCGR_PEP_ID=MMETSP0370-20130417/13507_1 /TAXON_ID=268820 /ORGANISM="Peridinium aciculiferum, Strain PAER-2" /LENGTH=131 /DNA_ID=CAMNT_0025583327 /DNA_START=598 /DNA_END=994 /DNA_ORIENTATION=-
MKRTPPASSDPHHTVRDGAGHNIFNESCARALLPQLVCRRRRRLRSKTAAGVLLESVGLGVDMPLVISAVLRIFDHILPWHEQQSLSSCVLRCCLQSAQQRWWKCSIAGVPAVLVAQPIANGRGWADDRPA